MSSLDGFTFEIPAYVTSLLIIEMSGFHEPVIQLTGSFAKLLALYSVYGGLRKIVRIDVYAVWIYGIEEHDRCYFHSPSAAGELPGKE